MMPGSEESDGAAAATATTGTATEGGGRGGRGGGPTLSLKKGPWTAAEDAILMDYVKKHGEGNWNAVQKNSGLSRCGKSCRLRWANHLRPNLKKGSFSPEEERLILELHAKLGNKWARMAAQMPGRTDNEIKNYWNTRIKRRQRAGLPLYPPDIQRQAHNHHRTPAMVPALSDCKAHLTPAPAVSSPLSLFDPMNFSATGTTNLILGLNHHNSFISPPTSAHRMKRLCDENLKFSLPFSAPNLPPLLTSGFQYRNYDLNPPLMTLSPQQQRHQQSLSVKTELPSSQFFPEPGAATGDDLLSWSNSGLLDALLLQNSSALGDYNAGASGDLRRGVLPEPPMEDVKWGNVEDSGGSLRSPVLESADTLENSQTPLPKSADTWKCSRSPALKSADVWENMTSPVPTSADTWESLTSPIMKSSDTWENCKSPAPKSDDGWDSSNSFIGIKLKSGPMDEIQSVNEDDMSAMLGIPVSATKGAREWFNNDSREASNGQSSVVTDDDLGLEMQQLASSMAMEVEDHTWSIGSCHWNNMPGIC